MLLWLMNLGLAGGDPVFFISGAIPVKYEASIIAQYEAVIDIQSSDDIGAAAS